MSCHVIRFNRKKIRTIYCHSVFIFLYKCIRIKESKYLQHALLQYSESFRYIIIELIIVTFELTAAASTVIFQYYKMDFKCGIVDNHKLAM